MIEEVTSDGRTRVPTPSQKVCKQFAAFEVIRDIETLLNVGGVPELIEMGGDKVLKKLNKELPPEYRF